MQFTYEDYRAKLLAEPFQPFRVVTTAGRSHEVSAPGLMFIGDNFVLIGPPGVSDPSRPRAMVRIAFSHVAEIEDIADQKAA